MLIISKAISQLLLPPGGLILLGIAGLIFWKRKWGRGLVAISFALLWLLSTEPVRDMLVEPLEGKYPPIVFNLDQGENRVDEKTVIVLLGGGIYEKAPEYGGQIDQLGPYALRRTLYAADLAIKTELPIYATGGTPLTDSAEAEGSVMRRWLIRLGVPEDHAFAESAANTTWENAIYMREMLAAKGVNRIVLVTSAWHMPRSVWSFEQQGFEVVAAPADYIREQESYDLRSYLPRWTVLNDSGQALHEYLGLCWYRLKYG